MNQQNQTTPATMSNEELRTGNMENIVLATSHEIDPADTYKAVEAGVVSAYERIEEGVVGAYQKVENAVVGTYKKVEDHFVSKFLTKEGETVEEAKKRMKQ